MKIGMTSVTFRNLSYQKVIELCKDLDGIEWGGDIHVPPTKDLYNAKIVYEKTKEAKLNVLSYGSYYTLLEGKPFLPILETAKILCCPNIRIWATKISGYEASKEIIENAAKELALIANQAEKYNINIGLEYHPGTLTDNWVTTKTLLDIANKKNIFTYWQPNPNLNIENHLEEIENLKNYIKAVHVFYWKGLNRRPLKEGYEIWEKYLLKLDKKHIPLILEFTMDDKEEQFREDVKILKQLINN